MTMTDAELAEIRARAEAALSGLEATGIEEKYMLIELSCYRDTIALLDELAAARKVLEYYGYSMDWLPVGGKVCMLMDGGAKARAYLHSATEDADDRTT